MIMNNENWDRIVMILMDAAGCFIRFNKYNMQNVVDNMVN